MNEKNFSISLDCDDDVVLFEKDTFKVSRLKELTIEKIIKKLDQLMHRFKNQPKEKFMSDFFSEIVIGEETINFNHMKFETIRDCEILKVNNKGWQKGKLNIEICISPDTNKPDKVNLKLFPEEPIKPESTLDDIRKTMKTT